MSKWVIWTMVLISTVQTLALYLNYIGDKCGKVTGEINQYPCERNYITIQSIANYGLQPNDFVAFGVFIYFCAIPCIFSALYARIEENNAELDANSDTPDDFTIKVEGIPKHLTPKDIHLEFERISREVIPFQLYNSNAGVIQSIVIAYQMGEYLNRAESLKKIRKKYLVQLHKELKKNKLSKKNNYDDYEFSPDYKTIKDEFEDKAVELYLEKKRLIRQNLGECSKGIAFVTFKTKYLRYAFEKYWKDKRAFYERIFFRRPRAAFSYFHNQKIFKKMVIFTQAIDPSDIIWENLGVSIFIKIWRRIITFSVMLLMLLASYLLIYFLKGVQRSIENKGDGFSSSWIRFPISVVISIIIAAINSALSLVIRYSTDLERHSIRTTYNRSLLVKIVLAQFVNSCLIVVIAHISLIQPRYAIGAPGE